MYAPWMCYVKWSKFRQKKKNTVYCHLLAKSKTNTKQKPKEKPCHPHRKRDQWGEKELDKLFKRDKLPVIRQLSSKDVMYSINTVVWYI